MKARAYRPRVVNIASILEAHVPARYQRARARHVHLPCVQIDLGSEGVLRAAIGERHRLIDQPDDIGTDSGGVHVKEGRLMITPAWTKLHKQQTQRKAGFLVNGISVPGKRMQQPLMPSLQVRP
jgi:hypothetical protein